MKSTLALFIGAALFAGMYLQFLPQDNHAQEEAEEEETPGVTESEIETYIAVYEAMQADHGLTIQEAVKEHGMTLPEFRDMERRIQKEQRYVDRVREALLAYARGRAEQTAVPPDQPPAAPVGQ